jgi:hypothetical protein
MPEDKHGGMAVVLACGDLHQPRSTCQSRRTISAAGKCSWSCNFSMASQPVPTHPRMRFCG